MEPFSVRVESRAPRDARDALPDDDAADDLMDMLEDCDGIVSSSPGSWDAIVTVLASGPPGPGSGDPVGPGRAGAPRGAAAAPATMSEAGAPRAGSPGGPAVRVEA